MIMAQYGTITDRVSTISVFFEDSGRHRLIPGVECWPRKVNTTTRDFSGSACSNHVGECHVARNSANKFQWCHWPERQPLQSSSQLHLLQPRAETDVEPAEGCRLISWLGMAMAATDCAVAVAKIGCCSGPLPKSNRGVVQPEPGCPSRKFDFPHPRSSKATATLVHLGRAESPGMPDGKHQLPVRISCSEIRHNLPREALRMSGPRAVLSNFHDATCRPRAYRLRPRLR